MKKQRVIFALDSGNIQTLPDEEIKMILRAADELILAGGRNMLGKILKGSKDKKVLAHGVDQCPSYGFYKELTLLEIGYRIDWMIKAGYLQIEYSNRLPLLVFTDLGWEIERETYADEIFHELANHLADPDPEYIHKLKGRNRGMILLLIEKIKQNGNADFVPLLRTWKDIEYKKVQARLQLAIEYLLKKEKQLD